MSQIGPTLKVELTSKFQDNSGFLQLSRLIVKISMLGNAVGQ